MLLSSKIAVTGDDESVDIQPHKCCCLGLMLLAAGAEPESLRGHVGPTSAASAMGFPNRIGGLTPAAWELMQALTVGRGDAMTHSDLAFAAFRLNDGPETRTGEG